jgi:HPt (histidine-containing phosphotransfer) domain-containing protein
MQNPAPEPTPLDKARPPEESSQQLQPDPIDKEEMLTRVGGNRELLSSLIEMFPEESAKLLAAMREARSSNNAAGVQINAHTLKGTCKMFAAATAAALASDLEVAAAAGDLGTEIQMNKLCEEVDRAVQAAQHFQMTLGDD